MWKIYKHTFPNGKIYIGQTKTKLSRRFMAGNGYNNCPLMSRAIAKYGWASVKTEVIHQNITTLEEANKLEQYYIELYNSNNPQIGYNISLGGGIINKCNDSRILELWNNGDTITTISQILLYDKHTISNYLQEHNISQEEIEKRKIKAISQSHRINDYEKIYHLWQEKYTYEEIMKILKCSKNSIRLALEEYNISLEERLIRGQEQSILKKTDKKAVNQYSLDGEYIQTFDSIADANRSLGKMPNASCIVTVCKGNRSKAYGYKWSYA